MLEEKADFVDPFSSYHPMKTGPTALLSFAIGMHAVTDTVRAVNKNYEAIFSDMETRRKYEDVITYLCTWAFGRLYDEQVSIRISWEPKGLTVRARNEVALHGFSIYEEECLREDLAD